MVCYQQIYSILIRTRTATTPYALEILCGQDVSAHHARTCTFFQQEDKHH
jgi:hypothetical protein